MALAEYEIADRIALVTINNPPLNALDVPTKEAVRDVFLALEARLEEVRAVILTGAGQKAFAAGADIKAFLDLEPETARQRLANSHAIYALVENFPRPVIAAIQGYCFGGGLELTLCCDFRYASTEASFGFPEVNLGIFPGNGGTVRGLQFLTPGRLKELVFSGAIISADKALEYGLVEQLFEKDRVVEQARKTAARIAAKGPLAVAAAKKVINKNRDLLQAQALAFETDNWSELTATEDMKEGARAFLEKRKPVFMDR